ncbi:hypothetical protein niasHT_008206 [Heterodera trifolii]|uniref:Uncharacterized protein n=1 Tax=Heterodera trifolii TaxID=157864 RepID=A0ABD2LUI0_9BILA
MCKDEENGGEKFRINGCTTEKEEDGYGCPKDFDGICPGIKCERCNEGHLCNANKKDLEQPPEKTKLDIHIQSEPFSGAPAMMSGIGTGAKMVVAIVNAVLPVMIVHAAIV